MSWVLTILGIMALIVLHELGHFSVAKAVGMRVERFSLFFPPRIVGIQRGETDYSIGSIPAGGYVKITGMTWEEIRDMDLRIAVRAYCMQPPWKRIAVILAGPGVNILIAFVLFWAVLFAGNLNGSATLMRLNPSTETVIPSTTVAYVDPASPAHGVLREGDRIVAVEGRPASVSETQRLIGSHTCAGKLVAGCRAAKPVTLEVRRGGHELTESVYPRYSPVYKRMLVGFDFGETAKHFSALGAAGAALADMWGTTTSSLSGIGHALTSAKARKQVHSIIGITEIAHETVAAGAGYGLVFLGFFSLVLGVFNLFPFLPLDGGHVLWSLGEKLRGRRISVMAMYRFSSVGIVLLLFLVVNGISNDISHLAG